MAGNKWSEIVWNGVEYRMKLKVLNPNKKGGEKEMIEKFADMWFTFLEFYLVSYFVWLSYRMWRRDKV